jgi:hypothetical protein
MDKERSFYKGRPVTDSDQQISRQAWKEIRRQVEEGVEVGDAIACLLEPEAETQEKEIK